jgi:hypothetical protein
MQSPTERGAFELAAVNINDMSTGSAASNGDGVPLCHTS